MIPPKLGVRSYPVVERYNLIFIWTGDPEMADPNLILDYPPLADPKWRGLPGYMHYKANWLLIVDNLCDFAHLAFVHTNTLGGSEEYAYKTKPVAIEKLDDGFRVERWHMNAEPPPYHKKVIANKTDKIDRRNIGRMIDARHLPARHHLCTGGPGRGERRPGAGHAAIPQRAVHECRRRTPRARPSSARLPNVTRRRRRARASDRSARRRDTPRRRGYGCRAEAAAGLPAVRDAGLGWPPRLLLPRRGRAPGAARGNPPPVPSI